MSDIAKDDEIRKIHYKLDKILDDERYKRVLFESRRRFASQDSGVEINVD